MPRFQVMTPSTGAYVMFYCESCNNSISSSPDVGGALANQLKNSLLRQIPIVGGLLMGTGQAVDNAAHWQQVEQQFGECAGCKKIVCRGCYDAQQGKCSRCRVDAAANEVAQKVGNAAAGVAAGFGALAAGLGGLAAMAFVECPSCKGKTPRAPKCQNCGTSLPDSLYKAAKCSKCGSGLMPGAKFCPKCGGAAA
jgi:hypothetical protein